jgi:hypothetical protein
MFLLKSLTSLRGDSKALLGRGTSPQGLSTQGTPILCLCDPGRNFWNWPSRLESSSHGNKWNVLSSKTPASLTICTLPPSSVRTVRWPHGLPNSGLGESWVPLSHSLCRDPCSELGCTSSPCQPHGGTEKAVVHWLASYHLRSTGLRRCGLGPPGPGFS